MSETERTKVGKDMAFCTARIGIFKIATFVLSLISLIVLAATQFWAVANLGSLQAANFTFGFIAVTQLISLALYFLKMYNLPLCQRLPWKMMEVGYAILCAVLLFISMCICASAADQQTGVEGNLEASFICCAIFAAVLMLGFGVAAFITFRSDKIRSQPTHVNT